MTSSNPGLARAVAEVTQPFGAPVSGDVLRSLQVHSYPSLSIPILFVRQSVHET